MNSPNISMFMIFFLSCQHLQYIRQCTWAYKRPARSDVQYMYCAQWPMPLHIIGWEYPGDPIKLYFFRSLWLIMNIYIPSLIYLFICLKVFLNAVTARKKKMQLRSRDMEWWMRRRQLPSCLRRRVRHFERQRWATMGEDALQWIDDLPEGLRRDIKRHLCLDLIKKVTG